MVPTACTRALAHPHVRTFHAPPRCPPVHRVALPLLLQLMMDGKKVQISPDDYVFAALNLYLDVINLFLYLLRLFGDRRD